MREVRDDLQHLINTVASSVHRRYKTWAEAEDIRQEMWVWALRNEKYIKSLSTNTLKQRLFGAGEKYARKEKATRCGYDPDDEQYYSLRVIREFLPEIVADELPTFRGGVDDREASNARRKSAGLSMEVETTIIDLRIAFGKLSAEDRETVRAYVDNESNIPTWYEVNEVLRRLQRLLGGRKPRAEAA